MDKTTWPLVRIKVQQVTMSWLIFGLGLFLWAGCSSDHTDGSLPPDHETVQTYEAIGVVKTITPTKNYINIDHEAISGFMGAMAMFFPVPDTSVLRNVAVDDSIKFTIEVKAGKPNVSAITVLDKP